MVLTLTWVGPDQSINPERWEFTLKMHLKDIFIAFWKTSESWNPAVAWKVPPMLLFGVHSTPVLLQWHVKDPGHSAKSAGDRLHLNMLTSLIQWSGSGLTAPKSPHARKKPPHNECNAWFESKVGFDSSHNLNSNSKRIKMMNSKEEAPSTSCVWLSDSFKRFFANQCKERATHKHPPTHTYDCEVKSRLCDCKQTTKQTE